MPLVVNSNISSLNAQRQLVNSGAALDKAAERLASGKRINSAADDAAGLAISNRQTSQIRGLDQAIRNANDGMSMIQTAEGAMDETTNILQRMRELAIQSSNGIYSDSDRATLDAEVQQLKAEITRIAESTAFNGQKILDGSKGEVKLQVGSEAGQTIAFSIGKLSADGLGGEKGGHVVGTAMNAGIAAVADLVAGTDAGGRLTINDQDVGDLSAATNMDEFLDTINSRISGVEVSAFTEVVASKDGTGILRGDQYLQLQLVNADGTQQTLRVGDTGSMTELADKINSVSGGNVKASLNDEGRLVLRNEEGASIGVSYGGTVAATEANTGLAAQTNYASLSFEITDPSVKNVDIKFTDTTSTAEATALRTAFGVNERTGSDITGNVITGTANIGKGDLIINGVEIGAVTGDGSPTVDEQGALIAKAINEESAKTGVVATYDATAENLSLNSVDGKEISIAYGSNASATLAADTGLLKTNSSVTSGNTVADLDISTLEGAQKALGTIDKALEQINSTRAEMGAVANRLDFTMSNLSNVSENSSAARSRIMDADFAQESAALSRAQVLQQASQAMLAQANARPQQVLSLLQ